MHRKRTLSRLNDYAGMLCPKQIAFLTIQFRKCETRALREHHAQRIAPCSCHARRESAIITIEGALRALLGRVAYLFLFSFRMSHEQA